MSSSKEELEQQLIVARQVMAQQSEEVQLLRKLIFSAFDEDGNFCGTNRMEREQLKRIVRELVVERKD